MNETIEAATDIHPVRRPRAFTVAVVEMLAEQHMKLPAIARVLGIQPNSLSSVLRDTGRRDLAAAIAPPPRPRPVRPPSPPAPPRHATVDDLRVQHVVNGLPARDLTHAEMRAVVARLSVKVNPRTARTWSAAEIAELTGVAPRTIERYRRRLREPAGDSAAPADPPQFGRDELPEGRPVRVGGVVRWLPDTTTRQRQEAC